MMESILVLTHADESGAALTKASLEAVTAGLELSSRLGAPLAIGIVAADVANLSKALPVAKILAVAGEAFAQARYATDAAACEAVQSTRTLPRLAAVRRLKLHAGSIGSVLRR
jgi:electron transfer flavoprotein alpha subunit